MIHRLSSSEYDLAQLWTKNIERPAARPIQDYGSSVVLKPWGYEYLSFENQKAAVWVLHLKRGSSTSMHCHLRKSTSLLVISGNPTVATLGSSHSLSPLDGVLIEGGVFHSTRSSPDQDTILIEIESPPDKGDLVRLTDEYGRENKGYEGASQIDRDLSKYDHHDLSPLVHSLIASFTA